MSTQAVVDAVSALAQKRLLIDVRDEASYLAAHAPGAVRLDLKHWETAGKAADTDFDNKAFWSQRIGELGVDGRTPVAIHDDGKQTDAARAWFILQLFGVEAAIIDGGWPALRDALSSSGQGISTEPGAPRPSAFEPSDSPVSVGLFTRHSLREALQRQAVQVFDARTAEEYSGQDARGNRRSGHLPGARNLSHTDLLDEHGKLKSAEALRALLSNAGIEEGAPIVTHCQGGGRAALAAIAALEAGFKDVHAYYLSFGDWAADESCPITR